MMLLDAAFALAWCSRYEPWERRRSADRLGVWAVRALIPLGQLTILAGTVATASGPHAGAHAGQLVHRFTFEGPERLEWVVAAPRRDRHRLRPRRDRASGSCCAAHGGDRRAQWPLSVVIGLLALQGVVGGVQWYSEASAELVWVHVALATITWLAMLWTVAAAGRLEPRATPSKGGASSRCRA